MSVGSSGGIGIDMRVEWQSSTYPVETHVQGKACKDSPWCLRQQTSRKLSPRQSREPVPPRGRESIPKSDQPIGCREDHSHRSSRSFLGHSLLDEAMRVRRNEETARGTAGRLRLAARRPSPPHQWLLHSP